jgi:ParB family transcriptional regulator, chromosome partitioning protein
MPGFVEEVELRLVKHSWRPLREDLGSLADLTTSIAQKGLLHPIVVRPIEKGFEVIAGHRRLEACRRLGMRNILCHVMELDDKEAFETSLIENLQHRTLNPMEEARAFEKYVKEYGYGGESELARRIGKSEQYVSQRICLLDLPKEVQDNITRRLVTLSQAVEMLGLEPDDQGLLVQQITKDKLSSREVRKLAKLLKAKDSEFLASYYSFKEGDSGRHERKVSKALAKSIASLRSSLIRFDDIIGHLDGDDWVVIEALISARKQIHEQIDILIRLDKRAKKVEPKYWVI